MDNFWQSNLVGSLSTKTFDNYQIKTQTQKAARAMIWDSLWFFRDDLTDDVKTSDLCPDIVTARLLILRGGFGTGKTHLLAAAANYLGKRATDCLYITEASLMDTLRRSMFDEGYFDEAKAINKLMRMSYVLVDDLAKTAPSAGTSQFVQRIWYRIIDSIYTEQNDGAFILTTNLTITELSRYMGGAAASRLMELAAKSTVDMGDGDYRIKKALGQTNKNKRDVKEEN